MFYLKGFNYIITIILYVLIANYALSQNEEGLKELNDEQIIENISPEQAYKMMEVNAGNNKFIILDLRTPKEYEVEHIDKSKNIDFYSENFRNELNNLDKENTYIIHCRSGSRAAKTLPIMKESGFKKVYNIQGIIQWKEAGLETVKTK